MASDYGNLGFLYQTRGELDRVEEVVQHSLLLFRQIGAVPRVEKMEDLLKEIRAAKSGR